MAVGWSCEYCSFPCANARSHVPLLVVVFILATSVGRMEVWAFGSPHPFCADSQARLFVAAPGPHCLFPCTTLGTLECQFVCRPMYGTLKLKGLAGGPPD